MELVILTLGTCSWMVSGKSHHFSQLDLLPAHELKLRQVRPGMVHRQESLTLVCRPHEAKLGQVSTVHHETRTTMLFLPPPLASNTDLLQKHQEDHIIPCPISLILLLSLAAAAVVLSHLWHWTPSRAAVERSS